MRTLIKFWLKFRLFWSKCRWRKCVTEYPLQNCDKFNGETPEALYAFAHKIVTELYSKFQYVYDDITQLGDSMKPPAQCYKEFVENGKFQDDCDGYHSVLYYILEQNHIECLIATAVPANKIIDGHTFLAFRVNAGWTIVDYQSIKQYQTTVQNSVKLYYETKYNHTNDNVVYQLNRYDYKNKIWGAFND